MEYRNLGDTGLKVSVISMGCEGFDGKSEEETTSDLSYLLDRGLNFIDLYSPEPELRKHISAAYKDRRHRIILQSHLCAVMIKDQYKRTRDIKLVKSGFETMLKQLDTDYIDVGMIHYVDSLEDWNAIENGPIREYAEQMKTEGKILHLGMSSHNPKVAIKAARSGFIEVILFSINPCYDMQPACEDVEQLWADESYDHTLHNQDSERKIFYELCESKGIGIDVMKTFGGGDILSEKMSPFGKAFTPTQCIHYALTRPAVAAVMLGCKTQAEWDSAIAYCEATDAAKDYAEALTGMDKFTFKGHCMYCGHCAPCPVSIDVAAVTKFLNLTIAEGMIPETVSEHYQLLKHHASECIACGSCERNCPFNVQIIENMKKASEVFGL